MDFPYEIPGTDDQRFSAKHSFPDKCDFLVFDEDYSRHCATANPGMYHCVFLNDEFKDFGSDDEWMKENAGPLNYETALKGLKDYYQHVIDTEWWLGYEDVRYQFVRKVEAIEDELKRINK